MRLLFSLGAYREQAAFWFRSERAWDSFGDPSTPLQRWRSNAVETFKDQRAAAVRADRAIVHQRSQRRDRPCFQFQVGLLILRERSVKCILT